MSKLEFTPKTKKIINIVVDVIVAVILVFVVILAVSFATSKAKGYDGYTEIFGKSYIAVASDSMKCDNETGEVKSDNFSKGDLIKIRTLSESEAKKLSIGDIITFRTNQITNDGTYVLNTHRIVGINENNGGVYSYVTHGDNNPEGSNEVVLIDKVVGIYEGKADGIGYVMLFMSSSTGFFVCVVLPSVLVVIYFAVNLFFVIRKEKKTQAAVADAEKVEEKEKMRRELLAELAAQGKISPDEASSVGAEKENDQPSEEAAEEKSDQPSAEEGEQSEN